MSYVTGTDRQQRLLLPESLDDYIDPEHPVRFIDAFVDGLDLQQCGFQRTRPAETGRPPYAPGDLLKLYLWGYCNQTRSSRQLEREGQRNLEVIWLMRKLQPDFKTIADFRKDNAAAFKAVFRQFTLLCRDLKLFGNELVAIDGTKLKAVNSPSRNLTARQLRGLLARIDAQLEGFVQALNQADQQEAGPGSATTDAGEFGQKIEQLRERQQQYQQALAELQSSGSNQISLTDPDSRRMRKVGVGYNGQVAVDAKHKLIAEQTVVNSPTDYEQLAPMAAATKAALGAEKLRVVADGGYYDNAAIAACEQLQGVEVYLPRPRKGSASHQGRFEKAQFGYDAAADCYRCPAGATLVRETEWLKRGQLHIAYANPAACRGCPLRSQCTTAPYRRITRWVGETAVEAVHARVAAAPQILARRKALVEHPFGCLMFWMNQRVFLTRGLKGVNAEFSLSTLSYNVKRVVKIVGVKSLLAHLQRAGESVPRPHWLRRVLELAATMLRNRCQSHKITFNLKKSRLDEAVAIS